MRKLLHMLSPPPAWRLPVILMLGVLAGMGLVILRVSNAVSYMSNDPQACINCHIMTPQFATWQKSSHARVATCNDCHVPHDNIIRTYYFKAMDGMRHATMFTFRLEPEVIHIRRPGVNVVQENCIRCHGGLLHASALADVTGDMGLDGEARLCWDCHRETPHGRVNSLSSFPFARVPGNTPVFPEWMQQQLNNNSNK